MRYLNKINLLITICAITASSNSFAARTAEELINKYKDEKELGNQIAIESDDRDIGYKDQNSEMEMILKNAHGDENIRNMRLRVLEYPDRDKGDKSIMIFDNPRDVKGTAFLSHANILEPDLQWLYLPALKRVKRISSKNKSGPFMGSEFSFEDITSNEIGKYDFKYISSEPCPSNNEEIKKLKCFKVESYPKYEHSGYTKRVAWMDYDQFRLIKVDYYDRKDSLVKTQTNSGYKKYLDKYWRADSWKMENLQNGKSTILKFNNYEFNNGYNESDFEENVLRQIR